jgi:predicted component of type VI protein secretion system
MIPLGEISRKHCRIIRDGDTLRLEDLGSSNGTFHNGRRVQEAVLEPGDTVQVGPVSFVVQIDGVPADDEIQPHTKSAAASLGDEDDELGALSDDELEAAPTGDLGAEDDDLQPLGDIAGTDDELDAMSLEDDEAPQPRSAGKSSAQDDELEVLSEDTGGGPGLDLDDEIGQNLALDDSNKIDLTDSEAGGVSLDDEKSKPRRK